MNIAILGGKGTIGSYFKDSYKFDCYSRKNLDIENIPMDKFEMHDGFFNLAANTNLDDCECYFLDSFNINTAAAIDLFELCLTYNKKYIHAGTLMEYVEPRCWYVKTKEMFYEAYKHYKYPLSYYFRLGAVFGGGRGFDKKIVGWVINNAENDLPINIVKNYYIPPLYAKDFYDYCENYDFDNRGEEVNIANDFSVSLSIFVATILEIMGYKAVIHEIDYKDFNFISARSSFAKPDYCKTNFIGDCGRIEKLRDWRDSLEEYLNNEWLN